MMKTKKLSVLFSALALCLAIGGMASCKEEEPPPPAPEESEFIFPADDDPITYRNINEGSGTQYDRYECREGYYELEHPGNGTEVFYSFSVSQTGLYALYTLDTIAESDGVTIMRYDASSQYIPMDDQGNLIGEAAVLVPDKNVLYSKVNCSEKHAGTESDRRNWRATYGVTCEKAATLRVRFVRIGDPLKEAETITTKVSATELKGRVLNTQTGEYDNTIVGKQALDVPFGASVFYDENYTFEVQSLTDPTKTETVKGFYRMGTKEAPGAVVYMAIDSVPSRLFADMAFTEIYYEGGSLSVQIGTDEDGNYLVNDYVDFFMNDGGVETAAKDTSKLCYKNCANVDTEEINDNTQVGMYPVNRELYEFLTAYVKKNPPALEAAELVTYADTLWLAPCYYYEDVVFGSSRYPHNLQEGATTAEWTEEYAQQYYNIKWVKTTTEQGIEVTSGKFALACTTENAVVCYGQTNYFVVKDGEDYKFVVYDEWGEIEAEYDTIELEADAATGATFSIAYIDEDTTIPPDGVTFTLVKIDEE